MLIGILNVVINGAFLWYFSDLESQMESKLSEHRETRLEEIKRELKQARTHEDRQRVEMKTNMEESGNALASTVGKGLFFVIKAILGCFVAVGAMLIVLSSCAKHIRAGRPRPLSRFIYLGDG